MKKLKFLPSVLMLAMCIAVLCVGIYAASPTNNTVKGSITVTSMARIKITGYVNEEEYFSTRNTANGVEWDLTKSNLLKFDAVNASDESEVPQKIIRLRIQNLSTMPLGAYFYSGQGLIKDGDTEYASYESLQHSQEIYPVGMADGDKNADTKLADVTLSTYTYLAPKSEDTDYDEIDMYITIDIANLFYEEYEGEFEFNLRVEEYKEGSLGTAKKLTKLANPTQADQDTTDVYSIPNQTDTNTGVLVVPTTYTKVTATSISGLTGLEHLILPTSITTMADGCLANCWSLKSLDVPCCGSELEISNYYGQSTKVYPFGKFFSSTNNEGAHKLVYNTVFNSDDSITKETYYLSSNLKTVYINASTIKSGMFGVHEDTTFSLNTLIIGQNVTTIERADELDMGVLVTIGDIGMNCLLIPKTISYLDRCVVSLHIKSIIFGASSWNVDALAYWGNNYYLLYIEILSNVEGIPASSYYFDALQTITINNSEAYCKIRGEDATIKIRADIIDGGAENAYLNNAENYTRSESAIDGYYVFTKVGA